MERATPMELKEIIVVTDGRSNIGGNPVEAARIAHREGIIVSSIGIVDGEQEEEPFIELEGIARAGGGICDIVPLSRLDYTLQMITRQSVQMTLERAVSLQLKKITGHSLEDMAPESRSRILEYIKKVGEEVSLKCAILLDCSGSMANKLSTAVSSIEELLISLKARKGKAQLGVIAFPGRRGGESELISGFTSDFSLLSSSLKQVKAGGGTPTYGGIMRAIELFEEGVFKYPAEINIY
jgi:Ca-activated chloride channel family protein